MVLRGCSVFTSHCFLFILLLLSWVYLSLFILQFCFVAVYSLSRLFLLPVICCCGTASVYFLFLFPVLFCWCLFTDRPQFSVFLFLVAVYCLVFVLFWAFLLLLWVIECFCLLVPYSYAVLYRILSCSFDCFSIFSVVSDFCIVGFYVGPV